jgi:hypothetical protein
MKKVISAIGGISSLLTPMLVFAQPNTSIVDSWITTLVRYAGQAVTWLMIAATLYFLWTVFEYIKEKSGDKVKEKKEKMVRGIIGLVIMVSIWGIVRLITNTLGLGPNQLDPRNISCPPGTTYQPAFGGSPAGCR